LFVRQDQRHNGEAGGKPLLRVWSVTANEKPERKRPGVQQLGRKRPQVAKLLTKKERRRRKKACKNTSVIGHQHKKKKKDSSGWKNGGPFREQYNFQNRIAGTLKGKKSRLQREGTQKGIQLWRARTRQPIFASARVDAGALNFKKEDALHQKESLYKKNVLGRKGERGACLPIHYEEDFYL